MLFMLPTDRAPTTPGEVLLEEFLVPLGMTQLTLAARMGVPVQRVNTLINGKRAVSADTAWKLAEVLSTSPQFWMTLQANYDLWVAKQRRDRASESGRQARQIARQTKRPSTGRQAAPG
jgi:addiction module HigA family antidote